MEKQALQSKDAANLMIENNQNIEIQQNSDNIQTLVNIIEENDKRPLLGIFLSFLSCLFYSLTAVIVKDLKPVQGPEVLVIRGCIQIVIYLFLVWKYENPFFGLPGHRIDLFIRGIIGSLSLNLIYIAFLHISLGDATAIHNMSPIYVIFLAFCILAEPITCLQLITAIICCVGALFVAKPTLIWKYFVTEGSSNTQSSDTLGFFMAFLCSLFSAAAFIWVRKLKQTPVYTVTLYYSLLMSIISTLFLPFTKIIWPLTLPQWWKLFATGIFGTIDQICMTLSLKYENAGIISVSRTITIVMTYFWDILFFNIKPPWTSILGGGMIIVSLTVISLTRPGAIDSIKEHLGYKSSSTSSSDEINEINPIKTSSNSQNIKNYS